MFILGKKARLDVAEILAKDESLDCAGDEELSGCRLGCHLVTADIDAETRCSRKRFELLKPRLQIRRRVLCRRRPYGRHTRECCPHECHETSAIHYFPPQHGFNFCLPRLKPEGSMPALLKCCRIDF